MNLKTTCIVTEKIQYSPVIERLSLFVNLIIIVQTVKIKTFCAK